jgi:hypothetical protein
MAASAARARHFGSKNNAFELLRERAKNAIMA